MKFFFVLLVFILFLNCEKQENDTTCDAEKDKIKWTFCKLQNAKADTTKIYYYNELAIHYRFNQPDSALIFIEKAKELANRINYKRGLAEAYNNEAIMLTVQLNRNAIPKYHKAVSLAKADANPKSEADYLANIGVYYMYFGNTDSAIYFNNAAHEIRLQNGFQNGIVLSDNNIGLLNFSKGFYQVAIKKWLRAMERLSTLETDDKDYRMGQIALNVGAAYIEMRNFERGGHYIELADSLLKGSLDKRTLTNVQMNQGILAREKGNIDTSKVILERAAQQGEALNLTDVVFKCYLNLGETFVQEGNLEDARKWATKGLETTKHLKDNQNQLLFENLMGEIEMNTPNYKAAISNFERAIEIAQQLGVIKFIADAELGLSLVYEFQNQNDKALLHQKKYAEAKDSLLNIEKYDRIAEYEVLYELSKKEQHIKEQEVIKKEQRTQIRVLIGGLFAVLIITWFAMRAARIRKKKNKEIKHRNKNQLQNLQDTMTTYTLLYPSDSETVKDIQNKINAINILHRLLDETPKGTSVNAEMYLQLIIDNLKTAFGFKTSDIVIKTNIDSQLNIDSDKTAVPIAQIVTELISNIFKHAFPKGCIRQPKIEFTFQSNKNEITLELSDNGVGIQERKSSNQVSEGLKITDFFVRNSLGGTIRTESSSIGTKHIIKFPAND